MTEQINELSTDCRLRGCQRLATTAASPAADPQGILNSLPRADQSEGNRTMKGCAEARAEGYCTKCGAGYAEYLARKEPVCCQFGQRRASEERARKRRALAQRIHTGRQVSFAEVEVLLGDGGWEDFFLNYAADVANWLMYLAADDDIDAAHSAKPPSE